jgi:hypothetical protein
MRVLATEGLVFGDINRRDPYTTFIFIGGIRSYRIFDMRDIPLIINWKWMSEAFKRKFLLDG